MTKAEFLRRVYHKAGAINGLTQKQTAHVVDAAFVILADEFIGRARRLRKLRQKPNAASLRFWWPEFGSFLLVRRAGRHVPHPRTGRSLAIPPRLTIVLRPAEVVKQLLNHD